VSGAAATWLARAWQHALVRYVVVGVGNTAFSYGVYAAALAAGASFPVASLISLLAGIALSFKTQGRFVFRNASNALFGRFLLSWALIYALNVGVIAVFVRLGFSAFVAGALALPFNVAFGFVLQKLFVFAPGKPPAGPGGENP
jgi:putative flippase GtrA